MGMDCLDIIRAYMGQHGLTGLRTYDGCTCELGDIAPCGENFAECIPYKKEEAV